MSATIPLNRRQRIREATRTEVKAAAIAELESGGVDAVSFSAIGRTVGMTPQALYRYFDHREALLAELAADGYRDLGSALRVAFEAGDNAAERLRRLARAYRRWALAHPRLYELIFSSPAGSDERLAASAHEAMAVVLQTLDGTRGLTLRGPRAPDLRLQLDRWLGHREDRMGSADVARAAIAVVSRLHGLVDLELRGQFRSMRLDGALLVEDEVEALIDST
jgi:AcrR family transcriptional regulator